MPQELLRDVLRVGDASGRARRRLSILPLSIAAHAGAVTLFVIAPLVAEVELPAISSPLQAHFMPTVAPPSPSPPTGARDAAAEHRGAPTEAPPTIAPEQPRPTSVPSEAGVVGSVGVEAGPPVLADFNASGPPPSPPPSPPQPKLVRVGPGIREPKKIVHVAPVYPEIAQRARVQGTVILEAILDVTGKVERVRVLRSEPLLDDAAIKAVQQWRYTPTELNGVPVPVLMTITVRFTLAQE